MECSFRNVLISVMFFPFLSFESLALIVTPPNQYFILLLLVNFSEYLAVLFYTKTLMKKLWNCLIEWKHKGHNTSKWVKSINLPSKLSFINGSICLWGQEILGNFQNKSVSSSFKCVSIYILFLTKLKVGGRSFLDGAVGGAVWDYPLEHLVVMRD